MVFEKEMCRQTVALCCLLVFESRTQGSRGRTARLLAAADGIIDISSASVASAVSSSAPRAAATSATAAPACFVADLLPRGENLDYEDEYQAKKSEFEKQIGSGFRKKKKVDISFKLKVGNASVKRLLSGASAGAVSRTVVAPLETIRTHLMVGNGGHATVPEVFGHIMSTEGWKGLFRGNGVNVIRVAPSKAIERLHKPSTRDNVNDNLLGFPNLCRLITMKITVIVLSSNRWSCEDRKALCL